MKLPLPILILALLAFATCIGCAAPVQPELKSARNHQVNVDFENVVLLAKHGRRVFFPYSTPRCPYYPDRSLKWAVPGPDGPVRCQAAPASTPSPSELPSPEAEPIDEPQQD